MFRRALTLKDSLGTFFQDGTLFDAFRLQGQ
jgi:hypothetical protein